MMTQEIVTFDGDDIAYKKWLNHHNDGFVVNYNRVPSAKYMVLHRSDCKAIQPFRSSTRAGGSTERTYIKTCTSDLETATEWVRQFRPDGTFSDICKVCRRY